MKEFWEPFENCWAATSRLPSRKLLRISILRELARTIHTRRSEILAKTDGGPLDSLQKSALLECILDPKCSFKSGDFLASEKLTLLEALPIAIEPSLNSEIPVPIESSKLTRADRHWEWLLATEGVNLGWSFWSLECWLPVEQVESWAQSLAARLWPKGLVLFVESDGFRPAQSPGEGQPGEERRDQPLDRGEKSSGSLWRGKWFLLIDPQALSDPKEPSDSDSFLGIDTRSLPRVLDEPEERRGARWLRLS